MKRFLMDWRISSLVDSDRTPDVDHPTVRVHRALSDYHSRSALPLPEGFRARVRDRIESIEPSFLVAGSAWRGWSRIARGASLLAAALVLSVLLLHSAQRTDHQLTQTGTVVIDSSDESSLSTTTLAISPRVMLDQSLRVPLATEAISVAEDTKQAGRMLLARLPF